MNSTLRDSLGSAARTCIFLLVVLAGGYWYVNRPKPVPAQTLYLGNPNTACVYPEATTDFKNLGWQDGQGDVGHWEEFPNLERAQAAGYRLCR